VTVPAVAGVVELAAPTHAELVRQAAGGDSIAFERLIAQSADRVYRTARAILGDDADARDASQDAYVSAWRELPRLRDPDTFDAWLRRILVNACRAKLRNRRRVREISLNEQLDRRTPGPSLADSVGDTDLVARAFDRLDGAKRAILVMHYLNHESIASIANTFGVPAGTAKWRLSEARAALERALIAEGEPRR
jgi:RNA polymerase sigma-70 factor (ECF subfamily)